MYQGKTMGVDVAAQGAPRAPVRAIAGEDVQENPGYQHAVVDASLRARWLDEGADEQSLRRQASPIRDAPR